MFVRACVRAAVGLPCLYCDPAGSGVVGGDSEGEGETVERQTVTGSQLA